MQLTNLCVCVGITGQGVTVVILDDGLDYNSKDLKDNFVSKCLNHLFSAS